MFSALTFDTGREPLRSTDLLPSILSWVQAMGGWAAFGLVLWLLIGYLPMRAADRARIPRWKKAVMTVLIIAMFLAYLPLPVFWFLDLRDWLRNEASVRSVRGWNVRAISLTAGGVCTLVAVLLPLLANFPHERLRRIGGLARLSFKEALRSRVLYAFAGFIVIFLFAGWFIPYKPETQVSAYVNVMFTPMRVLLCVAAALIAGFSIPTDLKNQTIHTIVTKPVERFEIVLGRFLGFSALLTLVLVVVTLGSLLYVVRGVDPLAAEESLKARDPLYGELRFENVGGQADKAVNVGKEWDYRQHITAGELGQPKLFAVWSFPTIPAVLTGRQRVRCEFAFDIYRTNKGVENQKIPCRFAFLTATYKPGNDALYVKERETRLAEERDATTEKVAAIEADAVRKYGYYEVPSFGVEDYHTQWFDVPGAVLDAAAAESAGASRPDGTPAPALQARVDVVTGAQFVGMAKHDLYLRMDNPEAGADTAWFAVNYFKAAAGVWLLMVLVIGVEVALSTYLSGVIAFLVGVILFSCGAYRDFIYELATKTDVEGPGRAMYKIVHRDPGAGWIDDSTFARAATQADMVFRWVFRRFLDIIPNVDGLDSTQYVANGFNIPWLELLGMMGVFLGYLVPWLILAYYLLRWREIAGPL
jgi:hypothetical protein